MKFPGGAFCGTGSVPRRQRRRTCSARQPRRGLRARPYHSGAASGARFSVSHDITGAQIWTTALVLMAFGQVLAWVGVLQARRLSTIVTIGAGQAATPAGRPAEQGRHPR
ncbi:MAG TPA: hypothetical protein VIL16_05590 [Trebonia sp.]